MNEIVKCMNEVIFCFDYTHMQDYDKLHCTKNKCWQPETLNRNESGKFGALTYDSTHHFFRNVCTKSGSLRFSQFSGCWLILSVYIIMSFDFPNKFLTSLSLYIFTVWKCIAYNFFCRNGIYFDKILVSEYKLFKRSNKANLFIALVQ
jgi:hypothetical protein